MKNFLNCDFEIIYNQLYDKNFKKLEKMRKKDARKSYYDTTSRLLIMFGFPLLFLAIFMFLENIFSTISTNVTFILSLFMILLGIYQ